MEIVVLVLVVLILIMAIISTAYSVAGFDKAEENSRSLNLLTGVVSDVVIDYLFVIGSDDQSPVSIVTSNRTITVTMPTSTSSFNAFTNIPKHKNYDMGNLRAADIMMNASDKVPIDTKLFSKNSAEVIQKLINNRDSPFIDELPNCIISATHTEVFVDTLARMESIRQVGTNTEMIFYIHSGEKLIDTGTYKHISIVIDDFWEIGGNSSESAASIVSSTANIAINISK